jgi:biotin operon repressor
MQLQKSGLLEGEPEVVVDNFIKETAYHCTATWHFARMTRAAELIYSLACVISKQSHNFFCSAPNLATYLGYERRQIYRGLQELEDHGFFEVKSRQSFHATVYRVVLHHEWAEKHPGCCATKQAFPWDGEGDELGRKLFALSGGRHRFVEYEIKMLRSSLLSEGIILAEWEDFISRWKPLNNQDRRYAFSRFFDLLKVKHGNPDRMEVLIFRLYEMSGYVFAGGRRSDLGSIARHHSDDEIVERFAGHLADATESSRAVRAFCKEIRTEQVGQLRTVDDPQTAPSLVETP